MLLVKRGGSWVPAESGVTEHQAYADYAAHVKECRNCEARIGRLCTDGQRLHARWKAAEERQPAAAR